MSRHTFRAKAAPPPTFDLNPRRDPPLDFPFRKFGEMSPEDYDAIGFICGLEVHQQLETTSKLFCRCPSGRRSTRVDAEVLRHMRPTLSELGQYDGCALMEFKTRKEIVYLLQRDSVCTYEMDDTPPFEIDDESVRIALRASRLLNLNLVSELQVMRKQYLDGSIPTGFQRSTMVAVGGEIPFRDSELGKDRVIRIRQLTVEEDSCREVSDIGHRITFKTDRLGTPLIETVTEPDFLTPNDVVAGGRLLARVVRATGQVRRGMGAARQDVNVSIAGSRRIELKGVAHHRGLARTVHIEAMRQLALLKIAAELGDRGVTEEMLTIPSDGMPWQSDLVFDCRQTLIGAGNTVIRAAIERGAMAAVVRLPRFGGLLGLRTQPGKDFASEFADRVRVIACLEARPSIFVSDRPTPAIDERTWLYLWKEVGADREKDVLVVVYGPPEDVAVGAWEVLLRARDAVVGVPSETRQVFPDGTNGLERILPGPERMYPDTDTPPYAIPEAWVEETEESLPERPWEREDRYRKTGVKKTGVVKLAASPWADLFDELAPKTKSGASRLAFAFEKRLVEHWRRVGNRDLPSAERLQPLVDAMDARKLKPQVYEACFSKLLAEPARDAAEIVAEFHQPEDHGDAARQELEGLVAGLGFARSEAHAKSSDGLFRWAMGRVMPPMIGKVTPVEVRMSVMHAMAAHENQAGGREKAVEE